MYKVLSFYVPYRIKVLHKDVLVAKNICTLVGVSHEPGYGYRAIIETSKGRIIKTSAENVKPLLRPLSDLNSKPWLSDDLYNQYFRLKDDPICKFDNIEYNEKYDNTLIRFEDKEIAFSFNLGFLKIQEFLLRNHFDIFSKIKENKAININEYNEL